MSVFGWFLALFGVVGLVVGLLQMLKGKKLNAVPFRAPSQIAQLGQGAADPKGLVSTEGSVLQQNLLVAPMSGRPCLAYEITVERKWEKQEKTERGMETRKGSDKVFSQYNGAVFALGDGAGAVMVDASQQPDASMEKAHSSAMNVGILGIIPGTLQFGNFQMNTPTIVSLDSRTVGFEGTEKIIPPSPTLYALGQLAAGPQGPVLHTPKGIGTGKLILSSKGRASLVKSTKRNMVLGYALGGALFVGGTALGIFGPAPAASASTSCPSAITDGLSCDGRIYAANGEDIAWTVATAGDYTITVKQPNVKYPIDATLTVTDANGEQVAYNDGGSPGVDAKVKQHFEPGTYTINVRDFGREKVKGGYGFHLDIVKGAEPAAASATITNADVADDDGEPAAPEPKAAAAAVKHAAHPAAHAGHAATAAPHAAAPAHAATAKADAKPADAKPGDAKTADAKGGAKPADAKPADAKGGAKPADAKAKTAPDPKAAHK